MTLVFACESRFIKIGKRYYANNQSFGDGLWERYLKKFENIIVFARVKNTIEIPDDNTTYFRICNPNVSFIDVPYYVGPKEYLKKRFLINKIAAESAIEGRAYICRVPGKMGSVLSMELRKRGIGYAVEVVGDPWDVFAPGVVKHPLSPVFRLLGRESLRKVVANAMAALYVTKYQLQKRYSVKKGGYVTNASDVKLKEEQIVADRKYIEGKKKLKLIAVGSLGQMYKSPDIAIETMVLLKERGVDCTLTWLGDGKYRKKMENLVQDLNVSDCVYFAGNVSLEKVREELLKSDILLHISRTEGLPRAIVEAMGAGLPCIGSRAGGIPELLEEVALVKKIKAEIVADKIEEFINTPGLMQTQINRNIKEAKLYSESVLEQRRLGFYDYIIKKYTL